MMKSIFLFIALYITVASSFTTTATKQFSTTLALHPDQAEELERIAVDHFQACADSKERKQPKPRSPAFAWCQDMFSAKKKDKQAKK
mmetsp:Transcript_17518/g.25925  ORF Transcript_17518/g.25925 Transcript_17518/m.25925 type:complete len:87 (+) Transcript_17518:226-486(+)|eukprot:CAMPEP_0194208628 /NCGR_PEP_ID=MMETSP0156-20130528/7026_1 /TAXON_ID=33649 /ORGANISM="Thalassionema nitzschioides, Strain L26-B" /LENGTH=86 /DNA_ID=CAMNT_0038935635 /DNA_START=151 /DNA_END=411 /DNA_ORIENTATION=+